MENPFTVKTDDEGGDAIGRGGAIAAAVVFAVSLVVVAWVIGQGPVASGDERRTRCRSTGGQEP